MYHFCLCLQDQFLFGYKQQKLPLAKLSRKGDLWIDTGEAHRSEERLMKPWEGQGTAASRITWVCEANSVSACFPSWTDSYWSAPFPPQRWAHIMVPSDLRNEEEKLSKEQVRCCQKSNIKYFLQSSLKLAVWRSFGEFDVSNFRNKSQISARWRVNDEWGRKDSEGAWWLGRRKNGNI